MDQRANRCACDTMSLAATPMRIASGHENVWKYMEIYGDAGKCAKFKFRSRCLREYGRCVVPAKKQRTPCCDGCCRKPLVKAAMVRRRRVRVSTSMAHLIRDMVCISRKDLRCSEIIWEMT